MITSPKILHTVCAHHYLLLHSNTAFLLLIHMEFLPLLSNLKFLIWKVPFLEKHLVEDLLKSCTQRASTLLRGASPTIREGNIPIEALLQ